jgi:hypothetical protein
MRDGDGTLLASVVRYFDEHPEDLEKFRLVLRGRIPGVSLRLLDYLVTNYSKATNASFVAPNGDRVKLFREYKAQLRGYSKLAFDPFARRCRIVVEFDGVPMETTVAQLNFFRWATSRGVVDYASERAAEIEATYAKNRGNKISKSENAKSGGGPAPTSTSTVTTTGVADERVSKSDERSATSRHLLSF